MKRTFSIGWDVGGWSTKKGDAIWILDDNAVTVGTPRQGTLKPVIEKSADVEQFMAALFEWCGESLPSGEAVITLAIDAPLALPSGIRNLLEGKAEAASCTKTIQNPYLFRKTDAFAAENRKPRRNPLSPIQDQIGSQATKVIHVLNKFGFRPGADGVWQSKKAGARATRIIEAYPAMSKQSKEGLVDSPHMTSAFERETEHQNALTWDQKDSLICALTAHLFTQDPSSLHPPEHDHFLPEEGWIWFPKRHS